ncbi:hypothetical protein ACJEE1_16945, partial [Bacteroides intestinalis]|uniref:hypothetical protein n=1 Tax=Bacteroides intestinalis TaxID=329854 RepID=UPI0039780C62
MSNIHFQQNLNNRKEKLREEQHTIVGFSFGEWFVEKMLSKYSSVYKWITLPVWKIQCKLPPKTKRFYPLKTFNNAPL